MMWKCFVRVVIVAKWPKKPHMKIEASSGHLVASKLFEVIVIDFTVLEKDSRGSKNVLIVYYRLLQ